MGLQIGGVEKPVYMKTYHWANMNKWRIASRKYSFKRRQQILEKFGGKCNKCGFSDVRALQLDHVNGGGTKESCAIYRTGVQRRALENPSEYQLLCANCNIVKRYENNEHRKRLQMEV